MQQRVCVCVWGGGRQGAGRVEQCWLNCPPPLHPPTPTPTPTHTHPPATSPASSRPLVHAASALARREYTATPGTRVSGGRGARRAASASRVVPKVRPAATSASSCRGERGGEGRGGGAKCSDKRFGRAHSLAPSTPPNSPALAPRPPPLIVPLWPPVHPPLIVPLYPLNPPQTHTSCSAPSGSCTNPHSPPPRHTPPTPLSTHLLQRAQRQLHERPLLPPHGVR